MMKTFLLYIFIALFALSLQASIFQGIKPDFILVIVCFYSLKYGQLRGMGYGALTGFMVDFAGGFIIGPNVFTKSITGFLFAMVRQKMFFWNAALNTTLIALCSIIDVLLIRICLETFLGISFDRRSLEISIMQVIYTALTGLITYPLFKLREG